MSLESITSALENFDLGSILPDLFSLLSSMQGLCTLVMMVSPLLLLGLGIWYLFWPRKTVGARSGFYAYFAMGSEEAWLYTQKMAGLVWTGLGGLLTIIMAIVCIAMSGSNMSQIAGTTQTCMIWQIILVGLSWLALNILPAVFYDKSGNRRN